MPLTNVEIKNAKPRTVAYKMSDGGGLHLLIQPTGSKLWRLAYRFDGKQQLTSFGPFPEVSLIEAREKREEIKRALRSGTDPKTLVRRKQTTFLSCAEDYIAARTDVSAQTQTVYEWYMRSFLQGLAAQPISSITPADVAAIISDVHNSGRQETARRLKFFIGRVFKHAALAHKVSGDPTSLLKGVLPPRKKTNYAAITNRSKFGSLLAAIEEFDGWPTIKAALKIAALCFVRPGEIRSATWSDLDLKAAIWHIPAEKMKMKRPHDVPLSPQALAVFQELHRLTGSGQLVFPQIRNRNRPISENAMNVALRRLGYSKDEHTAHGFRSSASTILNELGLRHDVIERQLAHIDSNEVRRAYNRAEYWTERVELMRTWANVCEQLRDDIF